MKKIVLNLTATSRMLIFSLLTISLFGVSTASAMDYATYSRACAENGGSASIVSGVYKCNFPSGGGGSSSGGYSSGGDLGTVLGTALGNAIADSIRNNAVEAEEAARQATEAQARAEELRHADEKAQLKKHEDMKNRLLSGMMNVGDTSHELQLMKVNADSSPDLQLMTGGQVSGARGSGQNNVNVPVGAHSDQKVSAGAFGTLNAQPDLEKRDPNAGAVGTNTKAMDQLNAVSHNDQALIKDPGTQDADSEKSRSGFDTGVRDHGPISTATVKSPAVSDKPGMLDNEEYKNLFKANQKLDSENQALKAELEALKKQRESVSGEEKGKTEMDMVKTKDLLDQNEYQQKLNDKNMNDIVDASVVLP